MIPLFLEQLLVALVGIADVFVVGFVGEAAVSGVSLVNAFNTIFINLFTALAAGGAVVISQYIGRQDTERAGESAMQLLASSVLFSVGISVVVLLANASLMRLIFGRVETDVMAACVTYLRISAYSYPALAVYNAGAALYRSFGKTRTTMYLSLVANIINVAGNCIGVFLLHGGVAGVAWPSLISRTFSAAAITILCFSAKNPVRYRKEWLFRLNGSLQKKIMGIAVPNGVESGIFQLVKVALSSVAAMFGTYQIAANGVAQTIWSMASLVCVAMGPVFIIVIGQCMGASDTEQAERYFQTLMKTTLIFAAVWNGLIFAATPVLLSFYALETETKRLTVLLVLIHNISNEETNEKIGFGGYDCLFPVLAVVDPEPMRTVPPKYTAYQGFDALFHSVECYISAPANLMGDMYALTAIEIIGKYLPRAVKDGNDMEAREHVAFANTLSGAVMTISACTSEHSMEHAMSAYHHELPHGAGLIMISLAYFKHFIEKHACDDRFIRMAQALGMKDAKKPEDFLTMLAKLQEDCGVSDLKMSDYGIRPEEFDTLAKNARATMGGLFACDRVPLSDEECAGIFAASYQ